jgi:hypothetical protein
MSDEERFEELKEAIKECDELLKTLKEDLALLARHSLQAKGDINTFANKVGNPRYSQHEAKKCLAFAEKYGIRTK